MERVNDSRIHHIEAFAQRPDVQELFDAYAAMVASTEDTRAWL